MKRNGFGERLKELIKQKQLTQAQVATAVGTSIPSVNRWTKGGEIEYDNLRSLAEFLEVNWIWLRYGDDAIDSLQSIATENQAMTDMRREYLTQILDNEARMKTALEMAQIVNWEWNVLSGTLNLSDNAESVFDCTTDTVRQYMLPFAEQPIEHLVELFSLDSPYTWDFSQPSSAGKQKWFSATAKLLFDSLKRPVKVIGVTTDISARKNAEQALERSEYMMRKIIETIPVGLWAADQDGTICLANPEVERIWGGAKYVGLDKYGEYKGWWDKTGKEVGPEGWTLARAVTQGERSEPEVVNIQAFDGVRRTIIMYSTPLYDNDNKIIGAIEVNQDISETKSIERTLKRSLESWQALFRQTQFDLIQLDEQQKIVQLSQGLQERFLATTDAAESLSDLFDTDTTLQVKSLIDSHSSDDLGVYTLTGRYKSAASDQLFHILHDQHSPDGTRTLILSFE